MDAAQLAMTTAAALAPVLPYLLKKAGDMAADEAIKKVGQGAWDFAKAICGALRIFSTACCSTSATEVAF